MEKIIKSNIYKKKNQMKNLPLEDQPRIKFEKIGAPNLTYSELIALILNKGSPNLDIIEISKNISKIPLHKLGQVPLNKLTTIRGIGKVKAIQILAAIELGKRSQLIPINTNQNKITSPKKIFEQIKQELLVNNQEKLMCIFLDNRNRIIEKKIMFIGTINKMVIGLNHIAKLALDLDSISVIIAHNHPSGILEPSNEDIQSTNKLFDALKLFQIELLDHLIINNETYFSFKENHLI